MCHSVIFYRSCPTAVSPVVRAQWRGTVIDLFNRLPFVSGGGNMPGGWCVDFVAACCASPEVGAGPLGLDNLPWLGEFDEGGLAYPSREYEQAWEGWLFRGVEAAWGGPPVFVHTLSPPVAYQGGVELCRLVSHPDDPERRVWVAPAASRGRRSRRRPVGGGASDAEPGPAPDRQQ